MKNNLKILLEDVTFSKDEDSVDRQIDRVIYQAESEAIQVAKGMDSGQSFDTTQKEKKEESRKRLSLSILFEENEKATPDLDINAFSNSILRCLLMYEKVLDIPDIIDIPGVIVKRAEKFLTIKYGEDIANEFIETIKKDDVASKMIQTKDKTSENEPGPVEQPLAVGAGGGGGAGGA